MRIRVRIATHGASFFVLPAIQYTPAIVVFGERLSWHVVLWWGNRGIQIEGGKWEPSG